MGKRSKKDEYAGMYEEMLDSIWKIQALLISLEVNCGEGTLPYEFAKEHEKSLEEIKKVVLGMREATQKNKDLTNERFELFLR